MKRIIIAMMIITTSIMASSNRKLDNIENAATVRPINVNSQYKIKNSAGDVDISTEYTAKGQDFRQKFIIIHYTAVNTEQSLNILTNQSVSSHYLITDTEADPIYNLVDTERRAWHAGVSNWKTRTNLNDSSIGIEIVNLGRENNMYIPYKDFQIEKLAVLLRDLVDKYEIPMENILAHSDIAPQRKQDPGPYFPWKLLYEKYGLGIWYDESVKDGYEQIYTIDSTSFYMITIQDIQNELKKFGYPIDVTSIYDNQTKNVISAFQMRFRPSNYDGIMDIETYSILKALNDKYN